MKISRLKTKNYSIIIGKNSLSALNSENSSIYNIAGPENYSLVEIISLISESLGIAPILEQQKSKAPSFVADISAMRRDLYVPKILLRERLTDIL